MPVLIVLRLAAPVFGPWSGLRKVLFDYRGKPGFGRARSLQEGASVSVL